jgi:NADH/F420H2 dehydrogenase subunit C
MAADPRALLKNKEAIERIQADIPSRIKRVAIALGGIIELEISAVDLITVATYLRENPMLRFNFLSCVSAIDRRDAMEIAYHMHSLSQSLSLRLKTVLDANDPVVDSVVAVWPTANWHEREAYDLFGVSFRGHPDLRRIMLEDDFEGHPMLKSYPQITGRNQ